VRELPAGTVTFLFSDIEGSTRLLHELGDAYADALAEHRRALREAFARHDGVEVGTEGDSFFVAFARASDALAAASEAQRGLQEPIRVRMGIHTGEPLVTEEGYVGIDVHRAARIAAAGHGGQILVSQSTRELAGPQELRDLGEHRLKDLTAPERIYQLGHADFPPLKTLYQTNLPVPATPFVGRVEDLASVKRAIVDRSVRLLTLTGPGGTGKTRLALQAAGAAADAYPDGVWWVALAPLPDPTLVLAAVARVLHITEDGKTPALDLLRFQLEEKRLLLVLDNFEHLPAAADDVGRLLGACPHLDVVVTSRERLRLAAEHEFPVPTLVDADAADLFVVRASALSVDVAGDPVVESICRRLDNLPLAIELAAARSKLFAPRELLERLAQPLDLATSARDADPRQATLRATIAWSYELLDTPERELFARLASFNGGFTVEAAERVCEADADLLASLLDKSLIRRRAASAGSGRFFMLETIREFALERFAEIDDPADVEERHAAFFTDLVARSFDGVEARDRDTLALLDEESGNIAVALEHAFATRRWERVSAMFYSLWFYWLPYGFATEAARWATRYLESAARELSPLERFPADLAVSEILRYTGEPHRAAAIKRSLIEAARANPDYVLRDGRPLSGWAPGLLSDLTYFELGAGRRDVARGYAEQALALRREIGSSHGIAHALMAVAAVAFADGDFERARDLLAEAIPLWREDGRRVEAAGAQLDCAEAEIFCGEYEAAQQSIANAVGTVRASADTLKTEQALQVVALLAATRGEPLLCARALGAAARVFIKGGLMQSAESMPAKMREHVFERARQVAGVREFEEAFHRGRDSDPDPFAVAELVVGDIPVE